MPEQPGAGRLDSDTLAAYVDGQLPPEERAKVEAEIAADPESYEWLVGTINAVDDDSIDGAGDVPVRGSSSASGPTSMPAPASMPVLEPVPGPERRPSGGSGIPAKVLPFYRRRAVIGGVGALVAAAASLLLVVQLQPEWWQRWRGPQVDQRFAKLVEAVGEERYIEARLTGGFKYGPLRQVMRGSGGRDPLNVELLAITSDLEKATRGTQKASFHALGVAYLLVGDTQVSEAIATLERAAATGDASTLSDLGASLLERWRIRGSRADLQAALTSIDRALSKSPTLKEALFNRALALEYDHQFAAAIAAWKAFIESNPGDPWIDEAQRHLSLSTKATGAPQ